MPARILVCPDKFKGSLSAHAVCGTIRRVLESIQGLPELEIVTLPIADGGEGTAAVLNETLGGEWMEAPVKDATGNRDLQAPILIAQDPAGRKVALMEMAAACGLAQLPGADRDPVRTTTYGAGQMLLAAAEAGVERILMGIGGSATNDGGCGLARALGFQFLDSGWYSVDDLPRELERVVKIQPPPGGRPALPEVQVACDVTNPLLGPEGATYVYGPQKGAKAEDLPLLEERMKHLANLVSTLSEKTGKEATPGAGAAGGLGYGLMVFAGAELRPGFELVAELLNLKDEIQRSDYVITGEGSLDRQSLNGKAPCGVARLAKDLGKSVTAFAGRVDDEARGPLSELFDEVVEISPRNLPVKVALDNAAHYLELAVRAWAGRVFQPAPTA